MTEAGLREQLRVLVLRAFAAAGHHEHVQVRELRRRVLVRPPEVAFECLAGFVEAHFARDKPEPKNFEEYCLLHFGRGISKHFMLPYNSRLWGVPPSEITSEWCQRFVPLPRLEDVLRGAIGAQPPELGYNTSFLYPELGMGVLSAALVDSSASHASGAGLPARASSSVRASAS